MGQWLGEGGTITSAGDCQRRGVDDTCVTVSQLTKALPARTHVHTLLQFNAEISNATEKRWEGVLPTSWIESVRAIVR